MPLQRSDVSRVVATTTTTARRLGRGSAGAEPVEAAPVPTPAAHGLAISFWATAAPTVRETSGAQLHTHTR